MFISEQLLFIFFKNDEFCFVFSVQKQNENMKKTEAKNERFFGSDSEKKLNGLWSQTRERESEKIEREKERGR